jgi:hypothetical protein
MVKIFIPKKKPSEDGFCIGYVVAIKPILLSLSLQLLGAEQLNVR